MPIYSAIQFREYNKRKKNQPKKRLCLKNYIFLLSEGSEVANRISAGCTIVAQSATEMQSGSCSGAQEYFLSYSAKQGVLHTTEIARKVRKTEDNYSGYLGNNNFTPVKSVMGYLVTHPVQVSIIPIFQLEAFTSVQFEQFWWTQEKCCAFCEFRLNVGLSGCTNS